MTGEKSPKKIRRRLVRIIGSLLSLAALTYVSISLITGRGFSFTWLSDLLPSREPTKVAEEFDFDVGRDRVFADLGGSLASAGTLGVQVLDMAGDETLRDTFRMSRPAISAANGLGIAFDIGGTDVRVFNKSKTISAIIASSEVVSASINQNGWFCICAKGSGGYKGVATVYTDKGNPYYSVSLSSGYILSAALSPDNKSLAVLNLTDGGSRITFYNNLSSEVSGNAFDLPGGLIIDIWYQPDGKLSVITAESLITIDKNGVASELYTFPGKRLGAYALSDSFVTLHLLDYGIGYSGKLVTLNSEGILIAELPTEHELVSISSGGGYLAALRNDGISFFDETLIERPPTGNLSVAAGASLVLALGNGAALAAGDHFAVILKPSDAES